MHKDTGKINRLLGKLAFPVKSDKKNFKLISTVWIVNMYSSLQLVKNGTVN